MYGIHNYTLFKEKHNSECEIDNLMGIDKLKSKIEKHEAIDVNELLNFTINDEDIEPQNKSFMYLTETPSFKFKSNDKNNTQLKENVQTNNQKNELKNISEIHDKLINLSNQNEGNKISSLTIDIKKRHKIKDIADYSSELDKTYDCFGKSDKNIVLNVPDMIARHKKSIIKSGINSNDSYRRKYFPINRIELATNKPIKNERSLIKKNFEGNDLMIISSLQKDHYTKIRPKTQMKQSKYNSNLMKFTKITDLINDTKLEENHKSFDMREEFSKSLNI